MIYYAVFINFCILSSKYNNNYKFNEKYDFGFYCFSSFSSEDRNTVKNGKIVILNYKIILILKIIEWDVC